MPGFASFPPQNVSAVRLRQLEELGRASALPIAVAAPSARGALGGIVGSFPFKGTPVEGAQAFLSKHAAVLGLKGVTLGDPVAFDREDGSTCVSFPLSAAGDIPVFRAGAGVLVERDAIVLVRTRVPRRAALPAKPKLTEEQARRSAAKRLASTADLGPGQLEVFDRESLFGDPGQALAWVFHAEGGGMDLDIAVSGSPRKPQIDVIGTPGDESHCPTDPIPRYSLRPETETPDFITFGPAGLLLPEATSGRADAVAMAFFTRHPRWYGTGDVKAQLAVVRVEQDGGANGLTHVVLQQTYSGQPVYGCQLRVHLDSSSLSIRSVSGTYVWSLFPRVAQTAISPGDALRRVVAAELARGVDRTELAEWLHTHPTESGPEAVVFPGSLSSLPFPDTFCWRVGTPDYDRFVTAQGEGTGTIVFSAPRRQEARVVQEDGNDVLQDGIGVAGAMPAQASFDLDTRITRVASLFSLFGRNSWDDRGSNMIGNRSTTPVIGVAAWNGSLVNYSPGTDVGDVTGHEFTHAVTQTTAGLIYADESGALNEHYSDVFGNLIFPDALGEANWLVGEDIGTLRDMANPGAFGQPGTFSAYALRAACCANSTDLGSLDPACVPACDNGGVHTNSGIGNLAAVNVCDGDAAHSGIGRPALARLYWETLTRRLGPWSTYKDEVHNTWEAARDLVAKGWVAPQLPWSNDPSALFTAAMVAQVVWGFAEVGLDLSLTSGWFQVRGRSNSTWSETFYQGVQTDPARRVADHQLMVTTPPTMPTWESVVRASGPLTTTDPSGSAMVTFMTGHVGTHDASFTVQFTNSRFQDIGVQPTTITEPDPNVPPAGPTMESTFLPDDRVTNWFDNPFFAGRKYDDTLRSNQLLQGNGTITDIWLDLFNDRDQIVATQRLGDPQATWGGTGAEITSQNLGGQALDVGVHSWHNFGWAVRYRITYRVDHPVGTLVSLPTAPVRPPKHK